MQPAPQQRSTSSCSKCSKRQRHTNADGKAVRSHVTFTFWQKQKIIIHKKLKVGKVSSGPQCCGDKCVSKSSELHFPSSFAEDAASFKRDMWNRFGFPSEQATTCSVLEHRVERLQVSRRFRYTDCTFYQRRDTGMLLAANWKSQPWAQPEHGLTFDAGLPR